MGMAVGFFLCTPMPTQWHTPEMRNRPACTRISEIGCVGRPKQLKIRRDEYEVTQRYGESVVLEVFS